MRTSITAPAAIAARIEDIDTQTGQLRGLVSGYILCERSEQRRQMRPGSSPFVVRPWEPDHVRLIMRGLNPLVSGDGGPDLDGRPLFLAAAQKYPERRDEFLAEVEKIDKARVAKLKESAIKPLTEAQKAERLAVITGDAVGRALAGRMPDATGPTEAPPVAEVVPKRGDAEPRATKARE